MAEVKWIKLYTEMFETSRKIKQIESMPKGDTIIIIWIKLLLLAGNINDGGAIYITPETPYTDAGLANELRRPVRVVKDALTTFESYGMTCYEDGILYITNWEKYQNIDGMEKIREKDRERKRAKRAQKNDVVRGMSADKSAYVRKMSEQIPSIEKEEEKEEESHSFIQEREEERRAEMRAKQRKLVCDGVLLSEEQLADLLVKLSLDEFDKYAAIVASEERKGHSFTKKTHYQAMLDMAMKDRAIQKKKSTKKDSMKSFDDDDFFEAALRRTFADED